MRLAALFRRKMFSVMLLSQCSLGQALLGGGWVRKKKKSLSQASLNAPALSSTVFHIKHDVCDVVRVVSSYITIFGTFLE